MNLNTQFSFRLTFKWVIKRYCSAGFCNYHNSCWKPARSSCPRMIWVRLSLVQGRNKYSMEEFIKDLLLDEFGELNLDYRCDVSFEIKKKWIIQTENLWSMIAPKVIKKDTSLRQVIPVSQRLAVVFWQLEIYTSLGKWRGTWIFQQKLIKKCLLLHWDVGYGIFWQWWSYSRPVMEARSIR